MIEHNSNSNSFSPEAARGLSMDSVQTEAQKAQAQPTEAERNEAWRQSGTLTIQMDGAGGSTITRQNASINGSSTVFQSDAHGVLATARDNLGVAIHSSEVKDETLVVVDGCEMTAMTAARMGYLERYGVNDYGEHEQYEQAALEAASARNAAAEPELKATGDLLSMDLRVKLGELEAKHGRGPVQQGLLSAAAAWVSGDKHKGQDAVNAFSSQIGKEPAQGQRILETVLQDLVGRVTATTASMLNHQGEAKAKPQDVWSFLQACNGDVQSGLVVRALHGDLSVCNELSLRYRQARRT